MKGKKLLKIRIQTMILRVIGNTRLVEGKPSLSKATGHMYQKEILKTQTYLGESMLRWMGRAILAAFRRKVGIWRKS